MELSPPDCAKTRNWKTVKQLAEENPAFSEASLRYHLFHRHTNGLNKHVRQIGRKIIIDERGFINEWLENNWVGE